MLTMKLKTILNLFSLKRFKKQRTLEEIWNSFENGESISKKEQNEIIHILRERNKILIKENIELKDYISQMQHGFDIAQKRLISKINSQ